MPDYKENKLIEIENYLEQTILQDVANPSSVLNRPNFTVATISRIMSNYIRTLRNVATRQYLKERLRDGTFNYKKDIKPSTAIGRTPI